MATMPHTTNPQTSTAATSPADSLLQRGASWSRRRDLGCALALAAGATALMLGRSPALQRRSTLLAKATTFSHYGVLGWAVSSTLAMLPPRRPAVASLGLAGLVTQSSWFVRYFAAPQTDASPVPRARIVSLNVEYGHADPESVVELTRSADVVVLIEVTPRMLDSLASLGFNDEFSHRIGDGEPNSKGTTIHSRYPLDLLDEIGTRFQSKLVRLAHSAGDLLVAGVHPISPMGSVEQWNDDARVLRESLEPHLDRPLVVIGDFNSVDCHHTMRALKAAGLHDAAQQLGRGPVLTWPMRILPTPLVAIDHALTTAGVRPLSLRSVRVPRTDHAALVLDVAIA